MPYQFTQKVHDKTPEQIWTSIQTGLTQDIIIKSIRQKIYYTVNYVTKDAISFSTKTRNEGKPEIIGKEDFISVVNGLIKLKQFNTNSSRIVFRGTKVYKKRSPMFALLLSSQVIKKI